uniref:Uncharacterized protein n=1 Tax=Seriola dumerili TaxID=41447 RepID=A0A3B4U8A2_SERDU
MENQSQASSAAEKKKRVETIVATKGSSARNDISEKAVASSTTSNGTHTLRSSITTVYAPLILMVHSESHATLAGSTTLACLHSNVFNTCY